MKSLIKIALAAALYLVLVSPASAELSEYGYGPPKHIRFVINNEYGVHQPTYMQSDDQGLSREPWRDSGYGSQDGDPWMDTYFPVNAHPMIMDSQGNRWDYLVTEDSPELVTLTRPAFFRRDPVEIKNYQLKAIGMINDARAKKGLKRLRISNALIRFQRKYPIGIEEGFEYNFVKLCFDLGSADCRDHLHTEAYRSYGDDSYFGFDYFISSFVSKPELFPALLEPKADAIGFDVSISGPASKRSYILGLSVLDCASVPGPSGCELTENTGNSRVNANDLPNATGGTGGSKKNPKLKLISKKINKVANGTKVKIKVTTSINPDAKGVLFMKVSKKTVRFVKRGNRFVFVAKVPAAKRHLRVRVIFKGGRGWMSSTLRFRT